MLNQVLEDHVDLAMDVATAYFNIRGYGLLREKLKGLGSVRVPLGAEPRTGEDLGLKPRLAAMQAALRGDLATEPYTAEYTPYQVYLKALFEFFHADLEATGGVPADLYSLDLAEFQSDAVERARRILAKYDGVMIWDSVGLGKTWIGLPLLLDFAYHRLWHTLIICPASLRPMWQARLHQTKIQTTILSQELLVRSDFDPSPYAQYDVTLIDESHNFRNRDSGRYDKLSRLPSASRC